MKCSTSSSAAPHSRHVGSNSHHFIPPLIMQVWLCAENKYILCFQNYFGWYGDSSNGTEFEIFSTGT
jgi:hypothetical protein